MVTDAKTKLRYLYKTNILSSVLHEHCLAQMLLDSYIGSTITFGVSIRQWLEM